MRFVLLEAPTGAPGVTPEDRVLVKAIANEDDEDDEDDEEAPGGTGLAWGAALSVAPEGESSELKSCWLWSLFATVCRRLMTSLSSPSTAAERASIVLVPAWSGLVGSPAIFTSWSKSCFTFQREHTTTTTTTTARPCPPLIA